MIILQFERSEGLIETLWKRGVEVSADQMPWIVNIPSLEGDWVQMTYNSIRDQAGDFLADLNEYAEWVVAGSDQAPFSDVVIRFT